MLPISPTNALHAGQIACFKELYLPNHEPTSIEPIGHAANPVKEHPACIFTPTLKEPLARLPSS